MEHDAPMARLHVPPTGEERAGVGAHRSNKYSFVFASTLFPELMASICPENLTRSTAALNVAATDRSSSLYSTPSEH
jgi:hypothetical protein